MMNKNLFEIKKCEVCENTELNSVLNLGLHPMCDDLVPMGQARFCKEYPIEILYCAQCFTAHQRFQISKDELFPSTYHYRSRFTADVLSGMQGLVKDCVNRFGDLTGKKILDVGCNDGSLLDYFKESGASTIGVEPTGAYVDALKKGHKIFNDYLSKKVAKNIVNEFGKPDFITFTNVFAHIENLADVLECLKILIGPKTILIIENHYLGSVLDFNQFDTFYHEHPRTYSYTSFMYMADRLGVKMIGAEFPSRYGGNIRVMMGSAQPKDFIYDSVDLSEIVASEANFFYRFRALDKNIKSWQVAKKQLITNIIQEQGPLVAKAFPGRAAILIKMLDLDESHITGVYEKPGSKKIGHYLPGTRIPIHSDEELFSGGHQGAILNLAWHISGEIRTYLSSHGFNRSVIDILSPTDFQLRE